MRDVALEGRLPRFEIAWGHFRFFLAGFPLDFNRVRLVCFLPVLGPVAVELRTFLEESRNHCANSSSSSSRLASASVAEYASPSEDSKRNPVNSSNTPETTRAILLFPSTNG